MTNIQRNIEKKWQLLIENHFGVDNKTALRYWHFDYNNDGIDEICIQKDRQFIVIQGDQIIEDSEMLFCPIDRNKGKYVIVKSSSVVLYSHFQKKWELNLAKRKIGIGIGRDTLGYIELSKKYFGFYYKKIRVISIDVCNYNKGGNIEPVMIFLLSNGRLILMDCNRDILFDRVLKPGIYENGRFFFNSKRKKNSSNFQLVVTANCVKFRTFMKYYYCGDYFTFLIDGKRTKAYKKVNLIARLPNTIGGFITSKFEIYKIQNNKLLRFDKNKKISNNKLSLICDWTRHDTGIIVEERCKNEMIVIRTLDGTELWKKSMPQTENDEYHISGTLGSAQGAGNGKMAILYQVSKMYYTINKEVDEYYISVHNLDGTFVGEYSYIPKMDWYENNPNLILDDIDFDGELELLVIDDNHIICLSVQNTTSNHLDIPPLQDLLNEIPKFPFPEKDLWNSHIIDYPNKK